LTAQLPVSSHYFSGNCILAILPTSKLRVKTRTMHTTTQTLNRASALPGKGGGQNILLPYKSRFNTKKNRFRVKSKTSQLCQEKAGE